MQVIMNIEKSQFEILITVYLTNAYMVPCLCQSIVVQSNSVGVIISRNGLFPELLYCPSFLIVFSPVPQVIA